MTRITSQLPPPPPLRSLLQFSQVPQAARASRLCCWGRAAGTICLRDSQLWKDFANLLTNPDLNPSQMLVPWMITWLSTFQCLQHLCAARISCGGRIIRRLLTWSSLPPALLLSFSSPPPTQHVLVPSPLPARPADALLPAVASTLPPWPPSMKLTGRKRKTWLTLRFLLGL